jgi:hypothetical protein
MILSILIASQVTWADPEKSAFERSLEQDTSVTSDESTVNIKGKYYRKIQFEGGLYYVVLHDKKNVADIYCAPPEGAKFEHLTEATQQFHRNGAFVQAFHESCSKVHDNKRTDLHLTPEMGINFSKKGDPSGD